MINTVIEIAKLVPVEEELSMLTLKYYIELNRQRGLLGQVPVLKLSGTDEKYLVCDYHHRTTARLIDGEKQTSAVILESDKDLNTVKTGILGMYSCLEDAIDDYEYIWKRELEGVGITSFQDYLILYAEQIAKINKQLKEGEF